MSWLTGIRLYAALGFAAAVAIFVGFALHWKHQAADRKASLETICAATRNASNLPKLRCAEVPAQIAFLGEALNAVRIKTAEAEASDKANKARVENQQGQINQRSSHDFDTRIADARARSERLRSPTARGSVEGSRGAASVPSVPLAPSKPAEGASQDGLPPDDALIATEQAIQLDEIIKWVNAQHAIDVNGQLDPNTR